MAVHSAHVTGGIGGRDDDLAALARQARGGSAAAFDALVRSVRDRVRAWAERITHDSDDAEDVAQLVLLRLQSRLERFDGRSQFTTWLFRITRNVAITRVRREQHRGALLASHARGAGACAPDAAPSDNVGLSALLAHFRELPRRQREVFELVDLRGLNSREAADRLGITASTVRGLLMKARRRIRLEVLAAHPDLLEDFTP
jgi:RNA polymerase sigma-70 factor (ECF subfamily)